MIMHTKEQEVRKRLFERLLWLAMGNRPSNYLLSCQSSEFVRDLLFEYKLSILNKKKQKKEKEKKKKRNGEYYYIFLDCIRIGPNYTVDG